jgi:hypothetical protein
MSREKKNLLTQRKRTNEIGVVFFWPRSSIYKMTNPIFIRYIDH